MEQQTLTSEVTASASMVSDEERRDFDLAQFGRLHSEQQMDMQARNGLHANVFGILTGTFSMVIGSIALIGFITQFKAFASIGETILLSLASIILFTGVIILFFMAAYYADINLAIGKIAEVMADTEKLKRMTILWDTARKNRFGVIPLHDLLRKSGRSQYHHLASIRGMKDISIRGFIVVIELVLFYLGVLAGLFAWLVAGYWIVLPLIAPIGLIAFILIMLTWVVAEHRRTLNSSSSEGEKEDV